MTFLIGSTRVNIRHAKHSVITNVKKMEILFLCIDRLCGFELRDKNWINKIRDKKQKCTTIYSNEIYGIYVKYFEKLYLKKLEKSKRKREIARHTWPIKLTNGIRHNTYIYTYTYTHIQTLIYILTHIHTTHTNTDTHTYNTHKHYTRSKIHTQEHIHTHEHIWQLIWNNF